MFHLPYLETLSPLYLAQLALTIWMLMDVYRKGSDFFWFWIILVFQPFGAWIYFFAYKMKDLGRPSGWLSALFTRKTSLEELYHRAENLPTPAVWLELAERLVQSEDFAGAQPFLQSVLEREPQHCRALYLLALCHRGLGHPEQAVPPLQKLLARQPSWENYRAWHTLIAVCREAGDVQGAIGTSRQLALVSPSLENRYLLASELLHNGAQREARTVLEKGLAEYRFAHGPARRRDGRWVGKSKQLLREIDKAGEEIAPA